MNDQLTLDDAAVLIQVYQKRLNDAQAQNIALEARTIRQQQQLNSAAEIIASLRAEQETSKPTTKRTTSKKTVDSGEF
jgi:hypothetical protein